MAYYPAIDFLHRLSSYGAGARANLSWLQVRGGVNTGQLTNLSQG